MREFIQQKTPLTCKIYHQIWTETPISALSNLNGPINSENLRFPGNNFSEDFFGGCRSNFRYLFRRFYPEIKKMASKQQKTSTYNHIGTLHEKVESGLWEFSRHAMDRMIQRNITVTDIREALVSGEIIEDYPTDKYGPSFLVLGVTVSNRHLHVQCSYPSRPLVKIITAYEPNPLEWIDFRTRRQTP
jgi:hypothetical protein